MLLVIADVFGVCLMHGEMRRRGGHPLLLILFLSDLELLLLLFFAFSIHTLQTLQYIFAVATFKQVFLIIFEVPCLADFRESPRQQTCGNLLPIDDTLCIFETLWILEIQILIFILLGLVWQA